eukprot:jgi/Ulvmu1/12154/UM085_0018.1
MTKEFILTSSGLQLADSAHTNAQVPLSVSVLGSSRNPSAQPPPSQDDQAFPSLREIAREVHDLGSRHLDSKHDAASFMSKRLMHMGIKLPKKQRVAANHGIMSLKKAKKREQQQEQDLIDSGFLAIRGRAKLKAKQAKAAKVKNDRGLNEAKGYKAGLLKVHADGSKKCAGKEYKARKVSNRRR